MITADEAVQTLLDVAQGKYISSASYSCIKEFTQAFPKKDPGPFIPDNLPKQYGGS